MDTPIKIDPDEERLGDAMGGSMDILGSHDDMLHEFPDLSLNDATHNYMASKRSSHLITVEGSPMVFSLKKRLDSNPTPIRISQPLGECGMMQQKLGSGLQPLSKFECSREESDSSTLKVLVISTESDHHETGDHQESVLRTRLLSGNSGCLRRPQLQSSLIWENDTEVTPIAIADLLR